MIGLLAGLLLQAQEAATFADLRARADALLAPLIAEADIVPAARVERLDGAVVYERRGAEPLVIASNIKVLTTAAALLALGPDFRWTTTVVEEDGRIWLSSDGDPALRRLGDRDVPAAFLEALAQALRARQAVAPTEIVLDARAFTGPLRHPLWPEDQWQEEYCAPVAALSLEGGCLELQVSGGLLRAYPPAAAAFRFERKSADDAQAWSATWNGARDAILVRGSGSGKGPLRFAVADPLAVYSAWLEEGLRARGIVPGAIRFAAAEEAAPAAAPILILKSAWTLADAVVVCNKESDNTLAEVLLRTLGRARGGDGSNESGLKAVREVLAAVGCDLTSLTQADGSGLARSESARVNACSPALLCAVLRSMAGPAGERDGIGRVFFDSLPIGGVEAKVRDSFRDPLFQPQRVHAKTGWIRGASSLSGYLLAPDGEPLVFAILVNYRSDGSERTNNKRFRRVQEDLLGEVLRAWPKTE